MKPRPIRTRRWAIIHVNCDCCSYFDVFENHIPDRWLFGPRCRDCKRYLGPMQWTKLATVSAPTRREAQEHYEEAKREQANA